MILVSSFSRMYHASTDRSHLPCLDPVASQSRQCRSLSTCSRIHTPTPNAMSRRSTTRHDTCNHIYCLMYHQATSSSQSYTSTHPHLLRCRAAAPTAMILAITSCRMYHTPTSLLSQLPCLGTVACSPICPGVGVTRSQHIVHTDISTSYQHKQQDLNEISIISNLLPSLDGRHSLLHAYPQLNGITPTSFAFLLATITLFHRVC